MKFTVEMMVKTKIVDAVSGRCVKESPWRKNLVFDRGLDAMAFGGSNGSMGGFANMHKFCCIGSGTNPVRIDSGAVTFTQVGTTVTASASFFTSAMVGGILKYGSGSAGAEYYILAFTNATTVTVDTSVTISTPTAGVVWQVQGAGLQSAIGSASATYITTSGSCGTTFSATNIVHKRTYQFPLGPYTVNEIGYSHLNSTSSLNGRLVLASTDSVGTTQFYVVILSLTINFSPVTPTGVANVGTNIDTSGTAMIENWGVSIVNPSTGAFDGTNGCLDVGSASGANSVYFVFSTTSYTQVSSLPSNQTGGPTGWTELFIGPTVATDWVKQSARGTARRSFNNSITTTGQTLYGLGFRKFTSGPATNPVFDVKFTTPQTAPTGTFNPITIFQMVCDRTLVN